MTATMEAIGFTLAQRAGRAVAERDENRAREEAEQREKRYEEWERSLKAALQKAFGIGEIPLTAIDRDIECERVLIKIDGITFTEDESVEADWHALSIVRPCADCGKPVCNQARTLTELGDSLAKRPLHWNCKQADESEPPTAPVPAPTVDDRLIEAIRNVVRDEMANQGVGL